MSSQQQREIEYGVYKQDVRRRDLMEEESEGMFSSYTDPSRNISVGNSKGREGFNERNQVGLVLTIYKTINPLIQVEKLFIVY